MKDEKLKMSPKKLISFFFLFFLQVIDVMVNATNSRLIGVAGETLRAPWKYPWGPSIAS